MALTNFVPKIWSGLLLDELKNQVVYANLANRDYEGDIINHGDTVKINTLQPITLTTYAANSNLSDPQTLDSNLKELKIDQANAFNFQIDDIDNVQSYPKLMEQAMVEAAYAIANKADQYLASLYAEIEHTIGDDNEPIEIDPDMAYEAIVEAKVILDDENVPTNGRWIVVPPWYHGMLLMNSRFIQNTETGMDNLLNGYIGKASGFDIYTSNNVPKSDGVSKIIAGYNGAWSFAEQILRTETYRMEKRFADGVKGLHVFGAKVTRPDKMVVISASKAS